MLLTEADSPDLEARRGTIEKLAADLKNAGINFRQSSGTSLDIYNKVTAAQPIYTAVANKNGAFDIIDKSVQRAKLTPLGDGSTPLFGHYNDRNKLMSLTPTQGAGAKPTAYFNNAAGDTSVRSVFNSGTIDIMSSDDIVKSKSGEIMYGHKEWNSLEKEMMLASIKVIRNGQIVVLKSPGKRELKANPNARREWFETLRDYYGGSKLTADALYDAALTFILDTIDSTTVNAAIKGGKDKYIVKPAKELIDALESVFELTIDSNIEEVANINAENPVIQFSPEDDITIKIIVNRPSLTAKGVIYSIYNTDKTILYAEYKQNMEYINKPGYEIPLKKIVAYSEKTADGKREFNNGVHDVIKFIIDYLGAAHGVLPTARANKAELQKFTNKVNAKSAEDRARKERDIEKQNARLDRKYDADRLKNSKDLGTVADTLWGSDEEYDKFLDSLL